MSEWEKLRQLYDRVGDLATNIVDKVWNDSKELKSRQRIVLHEQIVQDFLRETFQPLVREGPVATYLTSEGDDTNALKEFLSQVGSTMEECQWPRFNLVGAHYRSPISVAGRRSAIAVDRERLNTKLADFCPNHIEAFSQCRSLPLFIDFWQAVFLEQYFRLFGKQTTMNEWVLEVVPTNEIVQQRIPRFRTATVGILVHFNAPHGSESCEPYYNNGHWISIAFPKDLCQILLSNEMCKSFYGSVTESVNAVLTQQEDKAKKSLNPPDGRPKPNDLIHWFELLRDANLRAWVNLEINELAEACNNQCSYVTTKILIETPNFAKQLLENFGPSLKTSGHDTWTIENERFAALRDTVRVFQAMLTYTSLYGDLYYV